MAEQEKFEELVDELSALLLMVDFGSPENIDKLQSALETAIASIDEHQYPELVAHGQKVLAAIQCFPRRSDVSQEKLGLLRQQLEALTQAWYDASKTWEENGTLVSASELLQANESADAMLVAEFVANTRLLLEDLQNQIDQIRAGSLEAIAEFRRRAHTLKGESGMLRLDSMARLLHAAESYLDHCAPNSERADLLQLVRDWLADALGKYAAGQVPASAPPGLLVALSSVALEQPPTSTASAKNSPAPDVERSPPTELPAKPSLRAPNTGTEASPDPSSCRSSRDDAPRSQVIWDAEERDLIAEFLHESQDSAHGIDQTLLEIEHEGPSTERINRLFRAFHTIKGVASFLRMHQVVELTHNTETMLDHVRTGKLAAESGVLDLVFDATAMLRNLLGAVERALGGSSALAHTPGTHALVQRIQRATRGEVERGSAMTARRGSRLGEILVANGAISARDLTRALVEQKETGRKLGEELIARGAVSAKAVAQALRGQSSAAATQTVKTKELVRVDLDRVDSLVEAIGELVIVESMVSNAPEIGQLPAHLRNHLVQFAKLTRELQELGMCMRMVPLRGEFQKMARMVRDLTRRSKKQVRIELRGEQTEMDRSMVEQLADPLVHLIRNAVDHGVESPEERRAQGKHETATIVLSAAHEGGSIVVEISDDGRGIDRERVIAKAIAQGLINDGASLSDNQVYDLLYLPGFSTAPQVTEISGRGVGMDVVKRNVEAIRGRIITQSWRGRGTTFRIVLPLTLAIIDGMVVRCGQERFIIPTLSIIESLQPTARMLFTVVGQSEHVLVRGQSVPLVRLGELFDVESPERDPTKALVVIVESMHGRVAMLVDEVMMKHQVVIKTLGQGLEVNNYFAGAAILSNGRVGLILNIEALVASTLSTGTQRALARGAPSKTTEMMQ